MPLATATPAHADTTSQWPLQYLKASQDWNITKGTGATVAVLDTGVASISDTQNSLLSAGADFSSGGSTSSGNGRADDDGHGTGMAVLIAGGGSTYDGLAPDARILPVRVIIGGGFAEPSAIAAGIEYAISQHVQVINLSLYVTEASADLSTAVHNAVSAGIVVVAASGNQGSSTVDYPAAYPGVIAVGAVDQSGALWSNSNTGAQVTLTAPGVNAPTEDNTGATGTADGTSASTAYVSATVALLRAAHPSWTAGQVIRDLIATAAPASGMTAGQHSNQYGYGILDPLKALQAPAPTETSNPLLTTNSTAPAAPTVGATNPATHAAPSSATSTGLIIGIVAAVIAVILIILLLVSVNRRNKNRPGGPGGPAGGAPYGGQPPYGQHPQHNSYQQPQQNPYYGPPQNQRPHPPQQQHHWPPQN